MKYLTGFITEQDAIDKSASHHTPPPIVNDDDIKQLRFGIIKKHNANEWGLEIEDDYMTNIHPYDKKRLSVAEISSLATRDVLGQDGWFPVTEQVL